MQRSRALFTDAELALLLRPHVGGVGFVTYRQTTLDKELLIGHAPLLKALHAACPRMTYKKKTMENALRLIGAEKNAVWGMTAAQLEDWATTQAARVRTMCRLLAQAWLKKPGARWLATFGFEGEPDDSDGDEVPPDKGQPTWYYGYDREHNKAWRARSGKKTPQKEFAKKMEEPASGRDEDPMQAIFADGATYPIASWTKEMHRATQACTRGGAEKLYYEGRHVATSHKVSVLKRPDRGMLISMVEQTKQVLQVRVALFGDESEPNVVKLAFDFLVGVAKHYVADKVCRADLKKYRDERLLLRDVPKRILKRLAAATVDTPCPQATERDLEDAAVQAAGSSEHGNAKVGDAASEDGETQAAAKVRAKKAPTRSSSKKALRSKPTPVEGAPSMEPLPMFFEERLYESLTSMG